MTSVIRGSDNLGTALVFGKNTLRNMLSPTVLRVKATDYTNNTGYPIQVTVDMNGSAGGSASWQVRRNTNVVATFTSSFSNGTAWIPSRITYSFIVFPGQTYRVEDVSQVNTIIYWYEDRV